MPAVSGVPTMVLQRPSMAVLVIWVVLQGTQETEHVFWAPGFPILSCLFHTELKHVSPEVLQGWMASVPKKWLCGDGMG